MKNQVHFPSSCKVVGQVPVSNNEFSREDRFFIKDRHPELNSFGPIKIIDGFTGQETEVLVYQGILPPEYFCG